MATTDDAGGTKGLPGGAKAPLMIAVLVVVTVGGAYYAYFRQQAEYYTGRNLRLLSMLTAQIAGRIDLFEDFLRYVQERAPHLSLVQFYGERRLAGVSNAAA